MALALALANLTLNPHDEIYMYIVYWNDYELVAVSLKINYYPFYDIPWYSKLIRSFKNKNVNSLGPIFVFGFQKNSIFVDFCWRLLSVAKHKYSYFM